MPIFTGTDGVSLHYDEIAGGGDPLIALAGGARHPSYLGNLAGLDAHRRLVMPHLRGVGETPMPELVETASFWRQADDIDRLRTHLGLERVVLLGHSGGTRLALSYAAQYAERLAGLVLVTPHPGDLVDEPSDVPDLFERRRGEPVFDAAAADWDAGPESGEDTAFNEWWQRVAPIGYAAWGEAERAHAPVGRYSFAANRAFFSVDPPVDFAARLAAVTAPVLVVVGAADCSAGAAKPAALAKLFSAGTAVVIEQCGHFPWVERPAEFRRAVDDFLRTLTVS